MPKFAAVSDALGFASPVRFRDELLLLLGVLLAGAAWGLFQFSQFDFLRMCRGIDLWFDSDPVRTVADLTSRWVSFHERSNLHPLYSLFVAAPFGAVGDFLSLPTSTVAALYVALQSALYCGAAFIAMRCFGVARADALLGVALLSSTAAAIYWIGFTEWLVLGAVSIMVPVIWIAAPAVVRNHVTGVASNLISASMVVTSWPIGAAASLMSDWPKLRWRQAFEHTRDALAIMAALTVVQYMLFPNAGGFLNVWSNAGEARMRHSIFEYAANFFGQTLVAPAMKVAELTSLAPSWGFKAISSSQQGIPLNAATIGILALWAALWILGVMAARRGAVSNRVMWFVLGVTGYMFALHALLGFEMFLFSVEFAPLFAFIAIWSVRSNYKWIARALIVALIALSFTYNYQAFSTAVGVHNSTDARWLQREGHPATVEIAEIDCR